MSLYGKLLKGVPWRGNEINTLLSSYDFILDFFFLVHVPGPFSGFIRIFFVDETEDILA